MDYGWRNIFQLEWIQMDPIKVKNRIRILNNVISVDTDNVALSLKLN